MSFQTLRNVGNRLNNVVWSMFNPNTVQTTIQTARGMATMATTEELSTSTQPARSSWQRLNPANRMMGFRTFSGQASLVAPMSQRYMATTTGKGPESKVGGVNYIFFKRE